MYIALVGGVSKRTTTQGTGGPRPDNRSRILHHKKDVKKLTTTRITKAGGGLDPVLYDDIFISGSTFSCSGDSISLCLSN